jgi:hypothetical protein
MLKINVSIHEIFYESEQYKYKLEHNLYISL